MESGKRSKNILNQKFGRLTIIKMIGAQKGKPCLWLALCDCGKKKIVSGVDCRKGAVKSCGCLVTDGKHGHCKFKPSSEYCSWRSMKCRCLNPKDPAFKNYGGRGITVCNEWINSYEIFLNDMGKKPFINYSIERINNDKGYYKENCRWATTKDQNNNKRPRKYYFHWLGRKLNLRQIAELENISIDRLIYRIKKLNMTIEEAVKNTKTTKCREKIINI